MTDFVDIHDNISLIKKHLANDEKRHLPYAVKQALNELAGGAQQAIRSRITQVFDNARNWWSPKVRTGVKISFATKENLISAVFTRAHFAQIQEEGGIKYSYSGGNIAVPTEHVPKRLRSSKDLKRSQGDKSIFRFANAIYKRVDRGKLQKLYSLTPRAHIKPRFEFKKTAIDSFNRDFDRVFTKWFNYALATAR